MPGGFQLSEVSCGCGYHCKRNNNANTFHTAAFLENILAKETIQCIVASTYRYSVEAITEQFHSCIIDRKIPLLVLHGDKRRKGSHLLGNHVVLKGHLSLPYFEGYKRIY